jgi:hypothetical protein
MRPPGDVPWRHSVEAVERSGLRVSATSRTIRKCSLVGDQRVGSDGDHGPIYVVPVQPFHRIRLAWIRIQNNVIFQPIRVGLVDNLRFILSDSQLDIENILLTDV